MAVVGSILTYCLISSRRSSALSNSSMYDLIGSCLCTILFKVLKLLSSISTLLIKLFLELFKNKTNRPALILKTSTVSASYSDREEVLKRIEAIKQTVVGTNLPNIYLLHGEFTDGEINKLYNHPKVKAMVNLTKGEGYGRTLCEFSTVNKPIITTNWSGHTDFLKPEFTVMLNGSLTAINPSAANNMLLNLTI